MNEKIFLENKEIIKILKSGGVVVMPTDTIYGVLGQAENLSTTNRIYNLKKRAPEKPCIILIGDISELKKFSISLSGAQKMELSRVWPGRVSVIFDCDDDSFAYLHRGTKSLAFRLPHLSFFREFLLKTGPLLAPSANPEGLSPAENIEMAKEYFSNNVDMYVDGGRIKGNPSTLVKINRNGEVKILRN